MAQRRRSAAAFEARGGEDALRGDGTVQQIAWGHGAHPNQAGQRKRKASEKVTELFERRENAGPEPQSRLLAMSRLAAHSSTQCLEGLQVHVEPSRAGR